MSDREDVGGRTTLELMRTKLAVRDVGQMVIRGASRDELLAKYPELRDQDIELAKAPVHGVESGSLPQRRGDRQRDQGVI